MFSTCSDKIWEATYAWQREEAAFTIDPGCIAACDALGAARLDSITAMGKASAARALE